MAELGWESGNTVMKCGKNRAMIAQRQIISRENVPDFLYRLLPCRRPALSVLPPYMAVVFKLLTVLKYGKTTE